MADHPLTRIVLANSRRLGIPLAARALGIPVPPEPPAGQRPPPAAVKFPRVDQAAGWIRNAVEKVNPQLAVARHATWAAMHPREAAEKVHEALTTARAAARGLEDAATGGNTNRIYADLGARIGLGGEGGLEQRREKLLAREEALDARDRREYPDARLFGRDIPATTEFLARAASLPTSGWNDQNLRRMDELLRNREVEHPGFTESLRPVWGSAKEAVADYQDGNYLGAGLNALMAATDVFPTKAGLQAAGKVAAKKAFFRQPKPWLENPYRWHGRDGVRAWMKRAGYFAPNEIGHHWLAKRGGWLEKKLGKRITNQPWNILPVDWLTHARLHGDFGQEQYELLERLARGTPGWAKTAVSQAMLRPGQIWENLTDESKDR